MIQDVQYYTKLKDYLEIDQQQHHYPESLKKNKEIARIQSNISDIPLGINTK
jgi:hypothetical protein